METVVDHADLFNELTLALAGLVSIAVFWALRRYLGIVASSEDQLRFDQVVHRAISYGLGRSRTVPPPSREEAKREVVREAIDYIADTTPDLLKRLAGDRIEALRKRLEAVYEERT